MKRLCRLCVSALVLCLAGLVDAQTPLPANLGDRLVQGYVSGAVQGFEQASARLAQSLHAWCASPDATGRERLHDDFANTIKSWSGIEFLRFGPLVEANRFERIFFWPDPRGVTLRQIQALLAGPAEAAGDAQALSGRSVALQGLPALEYVLYRDGGLLVGGAEQTGERSASWAVACTYASAVGRNLAERGHDLAQAWHPSANYAALFAHPGPDNPVYRSQREVAGEAFKSLSTGLQFLREVKLVPVVGDAPDVGRARRAPFWRSGGGYQDRPDEADVVANLDDELARAEQLLAGMQAPIADLLVDSDGYRQLQLVILLLGNAKRLLDENIAPTFGVTIGFNALDGD